jgi:hypothetical protein
VERGRRCARRRGTGGASPAWLRAAPVSTAPPDWTVFRDRWDDAHALSAGFAALALASLRAEAMREQAGGALPARSRLLQSGDAPGPAATAG